MTDIPIPGLDPALAPATAPARRLPRTALPVGAADGVAHDHARPPRAQEPAHLRFVRRAARPVRRLRHADDVKVVVLTGAGDNFCSGGDVHEIIGPLVS